VTPALLLVRDWHIYRSRLARPPLNARSTCWSELVRRGVQLYPAEERAADGAFAIDPKSIDCGFMRLPDKRRHLDAKLHLKSKRKQHATRISRTANEPSPIAPKGLQRGSRAL